MAGTFEDLLGIPEYGNAGNVAELVYSSEVLSQQAEQMTLSADSLSCSDAGDAKGKDGGQYPGGTGIRGPERHDRL